MTCVNHPNLRWVRKDPRELAKMISNNPQLMFDGDVEQPDKPPAPFQPPSGGEGRDHYIAVLGGEFTFECDCSYADLRYVDEELNR